MNVLPHAYLLLLGLCFFIWPVVTGIPDMMMRIVWIAVAAACALVSVEVFRRSLPSPDGGGLGRGGLEDPVAYVCFTLLLLALTVIQSTFPPFHFSDELTIGLPGYAAVMQVTRMIGWPALLVFTCAGLGVLPFILKHRFATLAMFAAMAACAVAVAMSGVQSGLALRYPPLVHVLQSLTTIVTFGDAAMLRFPNIVWTAALALVIWYGLREWSKGTRVLCFLTILLGPLGWTYRLVLFQACGEITLGMATVVLLWKILLTPLPSPLPPGEGKRVPPPLGRGLRGGVEVELLGAVLSFWMLYRPSALAVLLAVIVLLLLIRRRAGFTVAGIALPIAGAWMMLSPYYTAQYNFAERAEGNLVMKGIGATYAMIASLPQNLHIAVLLLLIAGTLVTIARGSKEQRLLLAIAWGVALINGLAQNLAITEVFYGVARYNILLLLPLAIGLATLVDPGCVTLPAHRSIGEGGGSDEGRHITSRHGSSGLTMTRFFVVCALLVLIATTPFDFVRYAQGLRAHSRDIWRTPTEGYLPSPLIPVARTMIQSGERPVILAPDYLFLDLFVAEGLLTLQERDAMLEKNRTWHPDAPNRPVIVQAPVTTTYQPNLTPVQEQRLRDARTWALTQQEAKIKILGLEETIIVP